MTDTRELRRAVPSERAVYNALMPHLSPLLAYGFEFHQVRDRLRADIEGRPVAFVKLRELIDAEDPCAVVAEACGL